MEVIVGTAGHIDHGKTALVRALTGTDADRLPEEKRRGITVDLGFAEMAAGGVHFGFVDVPGHERFVKNMLAGASGIDLVLLVIEAGEGVMPQTREHFEICRLLGIKLGIIVLTKADLVDAETIELAKLDAAELVAGSFLENAPTVCVSARTGEGLEGLKDALIKAGKNLPPRDDLFITRLPIDRSFSMKGFGAVATGTLASGEIKEGSELELLTVGTRVRVRGIQTHGKAVGSAAAGQRVAVNLGGIDHSKVVRGMLLTEPDILRPTQIIDAAVEVLPSAEKPLRTRQRVRVHLGTVEALGRVQVLNDTGEISQGQSDLVQIRLESAVAAIPGERFIIRRYSPQATIAGGEIVDAMPVKHRRKDIEAVRGYLQQLAAAKDDNSEKVRLLIEKAGMSGLSLADLQARTGLRKKILSTAMNAIVSSGQVMDAGGRFLAAEIVASLSQTIKLSIEDFHKREPIARGVSREALKERVSPHLPPDVFHFALSQLESSGAVVSDKETIRLVSYSTKLSPDEAALSNRILAAYTKAGLGVQKLDEVLTEAIAGTRFTTQQARKFFQLFLDSGEIVKVTDEFYFAEKALGDLTAIIRKFADSSADRLIDVAKFKELAGVSRKYAIPLLEYFDRTHVTSRAGDKRLIL